MINSQQMRRLEAAARAECLERDLEEQRPEIEKWAQRIGIPVAVFMDNLREDARRIAEVGEAAWLQEMADRLGMTVDEFLEASFAEIEQE